MDDPTPAIPPPDPQRKESTPPEGDGASFSLAGCCAIVTGASSGLGAEFARQLAGRASGLVLAARNEESLNRLAAELRGQSSSLRVEVCACDLGTQDGRAALWRGIDGSGISPNLLINNAGLGDYGPFADADEARLRQQIDVNITALTLLAHEFARRVRSVPGRSAAILNVSSLAASLPIPDLAVYAASKSYVTSLSEALAIELAPQRVRVIAVCPGPTHTNFSNTARRADGGDTDRRGQGMLRLEPREVVAASLAALERGQVRSFPSGAIRVAAWLMEVLPRAVVRAILRLRHRKGMLR